MYLNIIILPLLGCMVSGFFGRKIGATGSKILSCLGVVTTTILAIISFFDIGFNYNPTYIYIFKWLDNESFNMVWNFQFDSLTVSMLIPILMISFLVHFYSVGYMKEDPHNQRFFCYLSLFTFMMIVLVSGGNFLLMFVGWEGVGVCSYLLVSFWFTRILANLSSLSAFITNRVGDCFLTIGMFILLWSLGNLDYSIVFSLVAFINKNIVTIIGICLLIGAMAKSSQLGLHVWLPMAMEGPTPVSALIHAATMVTAGVYLLIRSSPLIEYSVYVLLSCLWLGTITTIFSSIIGLFQQDVKKIIAYSTMSQLGMMVIAIGLSCYNIAIYHLINHAFYKALLFLGGGSIIHAVADNQDLRKYGGLIKFLPLTYTVILIASLSLVAFPFMTGFYSKDLILESVYSQYLFSSINAYFIAIIGAIFTILYSLKVIYLTFLVYPDGPVNFYKNAHEGDVFLSLPLIILAIFSIYFGYLTRDIFVGLGSEFFRDNSLFIHPLHDVFDAEFVIPLILKTLPLTLISVLFIISTIYPMLFPNLMFKFKLSILGNYMFGFFNQRFMIEFFYNKYIVETVLRIGGQTIKILDKGSIEWVGPYGIGVILTIISKIIYNLSKGVVTDYALYILLGICFYLSIFTFVRTFLDLVNSIMISYVIVLMDICNLFTRLEYVVINNKLEIKSELFRLIEIFFSRQYKYSINFTYKESFSKRRFSTTAFYMSGPSGNGSSGGSSNANGSQNGNVNGSNVQNGNVNGSNTQNGNMNSNNLNQNNNSNLSLEELRMREVAAREYQNTHNMNVNPEDLVRDRYGYFIHPNDLTTSESESENSDYYSDSDSNANNIENTGDGIASDVQEEDARESESSNNNPQRDPNESNNGDNRDLDNSNAEPNANNPQTNSNESDNRGTRRRREEDDSDYDGDRIIRRPRRSEGNNSNTSENNSNPNNSNSNRRSIAEDPESTTKDIDKNHMENMDEGSEFQFLDEYSVLEFIIKRIIKWLFFWLLKNWRK